MYVAWFISSRNLDLLGINSTLKSISVHIKPVALCLNWNLCGRICSIWPSIQAGVGSRRWTHKRRSFPSPSSCSSSYCTNFLSSSTCVCSSYFSPASSRLFCSSEYSPYMRKLKLLCQKDRIIIFGDLFSSLIKC